MDPLDHLPLLTQVLIGAATIVLIGGLGFAVTRAGTMAMGLWRVTIGVSKVVETDDTRRSFVSAFRYFGTEDVLRDLGFLWFGSSRRSTPRAGGETVCQIMASDDQRTLARYPALPVRWLYVDFVTWFTDDTLVLTRCPYGERVESERFSAEIVHDTLEATLARHAARVAERSAQGRHPKPIADMASYIEREAYFNKHYRRMIPLPARRYLVLMTLLALAAVAAGIAALVLLYKAQFNLFALAAAGMGLSLMGHRGLYKAMLRRLYYDPRRDRDGRATGNAA